jgi:hypothetical protein
MRNNSSVPKSDSNIFLARPHCVYKEPVARNPYTLSRVYRPFTAVATAARDGLHKKVRTVLDCMSYTVMKMLN